MFKHGALIALVALTTAEVIDAQVPDSVRAAAGAQVSYSPGTHRYRVTTKLEQRQEAMGETQENRTTSVEELTLDLTRASTDTLRFTFTVDSISLQSTVPGAGDGTGLKGRRVSGRVSPRGVIHGFDADSTGLDLSPGYRNFFVRVPAGALAQGRSWTDTVRVTLDQGGLDGTAVTITESRVVGDTTVAGQKAWRVDRSATIAMSGIGNQGGTDIVLEGVGTARGTAYLGVNGVYLGATASQQLDMKVQMPAASMTIPITQTSTTTVEWLGAGAGR